MDKQSGAPVTTEQMGAWVKSGVEEVSGVPVKKDDDVAPVTKDTEDKPVEPVKGASRAEPKGVPVNVGGKSGGKGDKPKSSSKKGEEEVEKEGGRVTRAMQKKLDEEEEKKKGKKKEKKDKMKKKKEKKVEKDEEKEKDNGEGEPVEKKPKVEEIEDVKVKVEELETKIKLSSGEFEVKTIGLRKRRPKKYRCRICKDVVDSIGERNRHMAEKHGMNEFKCEKCDKKFETENSLKRHEKIHEEGVKILKCDECDETFIHESQRKRHKLTHTEAVTYHCPSKDCTKKKGLQVNI